MNHNVFPTANKDVSVPKANQTLTAALSDHKADLCFTIDL